MENQSYSSAEYGELVLCREHGNAMAVLPYTQYLIWTVKPCEAACDACAAKGLDQAYGRAKRRAAARYEVPRRTPTR